MKPLAMLISVLFFTQLGGCANAQTGECKQQESRRHCPEDTAKEKQKKSEQQSQHEQQKPDDHSTVRRRTAPSVIERTRPVPPVTIQRGQSVPPPQVPAPARPTSPSPVTTCDAGGCWDNNANRYNGGASGTYIDNSGRPCHRVGASMQCF